MFLLNLNVDSFFFALSAVPPQFLKRPVSTFALEAVDVVFECEVTGSPAPTIKWVKNGDAVIPSDYFRITVRFLDPLTFVSLVLD